MSSFLVHCLRSQITQITKRYLHGIIEYFCMYREFIIQHTYLISRFPAIVQPYFYPFIPTNLTGGLR